MKIAILGTRGIPNKYGGLEQFAESFSVGLQQRGHDVTVYSPHMHDYDKDEFEGVKIQRIYCPESALGASAHFIYDYLSLKHALKQNFDILYEAGYGTSAPAYYLLKKNSPVVITNMDGLEWKRSKWNFITRRIMRRMEKIVVKKSRYIISDNLGIQKYYQEEFNKPSFYIAYGADIVNNFNSNALKKYDLTPHQYYVFVARLEPENNLETILDGYIQSGSAEPYIVVGNNKTKYGKFLMDKYKSFPGIRFLGGIYDMENNNALRHFSKIYFHGHSVGGTNPSLLEAMAVKAFIIAHDNPYNRAVLCSENLFFKSKDDVADFIKNYNNNKEIVDKTIKGNLFQIENHFNWNYVINEYEKLFIDLLSTRHSFLTVETV